MRDDPASNVPMVEWRSVEAVDGITGVLEYLASSGRQAMLATGAAISDESQIRGALARVEIDRYFSRIFCFKNIHLPKGEAFYREILDRLNVPPTELLMVGDSFEQDIQDANAVGIFAVWFNSGSEEHRTANSHVTVHAMPELRQFFRSLDGGEGRS
jgi:putative hydrolase of the HAD superfamily